MAPGGDFNDTNNDEEGEEEEQQQQQHYNRDEEDDLEDSDPSHFVNRSRQSKVGGELEGRSPIWGTEQEVAQEERIEEEEVYRKRSG